jgi:diacylglycerol kinase family enzyme
MQQLTKKHIFIIGPQSFRRKTGMHKLIASIQSYFGDSPDYLIHVSRFPRDALAVIRRYVLSFPAGTPIRVYAVGGDGILYDCLNGVMEFPGVELANMAYGWDNDFLRAFGEDKLDFFRDIERSVTSPAIPTDVICCNNKYALSAFSAGLEAAAYQVQRRIMEKYFKLRHVVPAFQAFVAYWGAIKMIFNRDVCNHNYSILADGKDVSGAFAAVYVSNSPCYGGDKCAAVHARPDDGELDLMLTRPLNLLNIFSVMPDYLYGNYDKHPKQFSYRRVNEIYITSKKPMIVSLDGELSLEYHLKATVLPGAVRFVDACGTGFQQRRALPEIKGQELMTNEQQ